MEDIEKERKPLRTTNKNSVDESLLTPPQQKAFAIAKAGGKTPLRSLRDLALDIEPELLEGMSEYILESRAAERKRPPKDPFK